MLLRNSAFWIRLCIGGAAFLLFASRVSRGQSASPSHPVRENSFLLEEAFNQAKGVVQHLNSVSGGGRGGVRYTFAEEWPIGGMRHQLAYTVPLVNAPIGGITGLGDVGVHYRHQLRGARGGRVFVAPRLSALFATGDESLGMGAGGTTVETLIPVSVERDAFAIHGNAGLSLTPRSSDGMGGGATTMSSRIGAGAGWAATSTIDLVLETLWKRSESVAGTNVVRVQRELVVSPGIRWAHELPGGVRIVRGFAFTLGVGPSRGRNAVFAHLSIEHPFSR
jgi:hypothetical protein